MLKNWTRENLAWVAGIIDGEGHFYSRPDKRGSWRRNGLQVKMVDRDILERLQAVTGMGYIYDLGVPKYSKKESYLWQVNKKNEVFALLVALYSWFSKRRKAQTLDILPYLN